MARGNISMEIRARQIKELSEKGHNYQQIAAELGLSLQTTRFYGGKLSLHKIWKEQKMQRIRELHSQGLTNSEIKRSLRMSTATIANYLEIMGLKANEESKIKWRLGEYSGEVE